MLSPGEVTAIQVRSTVCDSARGVFVCPGLFDFRIVTCNTRHADTVFVHEFAAGLPLVKKCGCRDHSCEQQDSARALKPVRKLEHNPPARKNRERIHEALTENCVREVVRSV